MTEKCIRSITFSESDVIKIIRALDVNKAHGHDNISVRMIKVYPVENIRKKCPNFGEKCPEF